VKRPEGVGYVVDKAPRPGATRTRLCPPFTHDQAARVARAFLFDTLSIVQQAGLSPRIVCRGETERQELRRPVGPLTHVLTQSGAGLGDALEGAFREGLADGYSNIAVIGADSPTVPKLVIREAFAALSDGVDVALGPVEDVGYYLLGALGVHPWLFHDMPWSTGDVASETLGRCRARGLRTHVLPAWHDVDGLGLAA
jgi:uncharacterized protein